MTVGALFFAYNTDDTDYLRLAEYSALQVKRCLGIPSSVITDSDVKSSVFDKTIHLQNEKSGHRYFEDRGFVTKWRNFGRSCAYDLSPYDKTLLLDVDYIIQSNRLRTVLDYSQDFLCYDSAIDVTGIKPNNETFGKYNMPMLWATVIVFGKNKRSEMIFKIMKMVEDNYDHYANLYGFSKSPFRNDYALSIAVSIVSGHIIGKDTAIPWPMINVYPEHSVKKTSNGKFEVQYQNGKRGQRNTLDDQDVHIMGKLHLEELIESEG